MSWKTPAFRPERQDEILRQLHAAVCFDTCTHAISFGKAGIAHTREVESCRYKHLSSLKIYLRTHNACTSANLQYRLVGSRVISERGMECSL